MSLRLLKSYVTDRNRYVAEGGRQSDIQVVRRGVPQGSILGPLLYIIHTNELSHIDDSVHSK